MLRRTRHSSLSTAATAAGSTSSRRSRCLGFISPRTATLLLALLGVIAHLQTFRNLAVLHDSFPHVPKLREVGGPSQHQHHQGTETSHLSTTFSAASISPEGLPSYPPSSPAHDLAEEYLASVRPSRWFNLLPKRPWGEDQRNDVGSNGNGVHSSPEEVAIWRAQQRGQDEERKSWELARRLTKIMRVYAFLSAMACMLGVYGVLKSKLGATRIFVISSFLDVFLFALSLVSFCIIITYPGVRAMLCEQISSGEIHAFLSYMHGANEDAAVAATSSAAAAGASSRLPDTSTVSSLTSAAAALVIAPVTDDTDAPTATSAALQPAARILSYATGPLWKRAFSSATANADGSSFAHIYWWDTLLDDMLENESCDDIFISVLVPLGLVVCLTYLAFRIHFLFVIRSYYTNLLRNRAGYYLCPPSASSTSSSDTGSNSNKASSNSQRLHTIDAKPLRKYSSSSSSSSTVVETNGGMGRSKLAEKLYTDKMA